MNTKAKEFNGVVNKNVWVVIVPKEGLYYTCMACINIDSVLKMDKKNYTQVYLKKCKYKIKKKKMARFTGAELELDDFDDSNSE